MIAMMTRDELIEWMGTEVDDSNKGVRVVIDCSTKAIAQEVADTIEGIFCGRFAAYVGDERWWRWIWLCVDRDDGPHINALQSVVERDSVMGRMPVGVTLVSAEDALRAICGAIEATVIDDLL